MKLRDCGSGDFSSKVANRGCALVAAATDSPVIGSRFDANCSSGRTINVGSEAVLATSGAGDCFVDVLLCSSRTAIPRATATTAAAAGAVLRNPAKVTFPSLRCHGCFETSVASCLRRNSWSNSVQKDGAGRSALFTWSNCSSDGFVLELLTGSGIKNLAKIVAQIGLQLLLCVMEAGPYGSHRTIHDLCDFLVTELVDFKQSDDGPMLERQTLQSFVQFFL